MAVSADAEIVREMAGVIKRVGWWNGGNDRFVNGRVKECVVTAASKVANDAVLERLQKTLGVNDIAVWNDAQANGQVVIERLLEIADKWEAEDSWSQ